MRVPIGSAALLLAAWCCVNPIGYSSTNEVIGGKWETEIISHSLGGDSSSEWLLLRKDPSILVDDRLLDVAYCGDDCVLYETSRKRNGASPHFRAACGDRQPALFVPPFLSPWRIKDCSLQRKFVTPEEPVREVFSRDEIRRRALAQPKASLRRRGFKREYIDPPSDPLE
jgi:hypothetical protein